MLSRSIGPLSPTTNLHTDLPIVVRSIRSISSSSADVMAVQSSSFVMRVPAAAVFTSRSRGADFEIRMSKSTTSARRKTNLVCFSAIGDRASSSGGGDGNSISSNNTKGKAGSTVPNSNYVVPLDNSSNSSCITRPLAEILRDLNKRIPDNIITKQPDNDDDDETQSTFIPWYHANRMLSFYAPGWCGEIRDVIFSDNGSVTVVYRVTIRGSDGEAYRESTGTVSSSDNHIVDSVAAAEELAFCRACARFGLGLYLYHKE